MRAVLSRQLIGLSALCSVLVAGGLLTSAPVVGAATAARTVTVQVVPRIAGVTFKVEGVPGVTGADGSAQVTVPNLAGAVQGLELGRQRVPTTFERVQLDHAVNNPNHGSFQRDLVAELDVDQLVNIKLITPENEVFPMAKATSVTLESSLGSTTTYKASELAQPIWLPASTPAPTTSGVEVRPVTYAVKSVVIRGANVVNSGQNRYSKTLVWKIPLLMHTLTVEGNDLLAGAPAGSSVQLTYPDQSKVTVPFTRGHQVVIADLPRGTFKIKVNGGVIPLGSTVRLSKDQTATEIVVTAGDVGELAAVLIVIVGVLVAAGVIGRRLRRRAGSTGDTPDDDEGGGGGGPGGDAEDTAVAQDRADAAHDDSDHGADGPDAGEESTTDGADETSDASLV